MRKMLSSFAAVIVFFATVNTLGLTIIAGNQRHQFISNHTAGQTLPAFDAERLYAFSSRRGVVLCDPYKAKLRIVRHIPAADNLSFELNIKRIRYDEAASIPYEIYIGLPAGAPPNRNSPYYVGRLALIGSPQNSDFSLDVTQAIRYLQSQGRLNGEFVSVSLIAPPEEVAEGACETAEPILFRGITLTGYRRNHGDLQ